MTRRPARAGAPEGGLVVDKSAGLTSHDVVALARRALGQPRIGHTGTLDPLATGVLPLLLGRATRLARFLVTDDKTYEAAVRFGQATTTYDAEGTPSGPPSSDLPDRAAIEEALTRFHGRFHQVPPAVSAKKVGGHRAYALVRAARPVALGAVPVEVSRLELTGFDGEVVRLHIECSSGFYVRSLAHDLGAVIGVGAHLTELRRTRSGRFGLNGSLSIAELSAADDGIVQRRLITMSDLLSDLPARELTAEEVERVRAGRGVMPLSIPGGAPIEVGFVRLLAGTGSLAAVAEVRGGVLHPLVVLM
jgi:tRNA pseudouridine55 synthase